MNLPDYLAPAPEINESAHGFDFPFRAHSPSWADERHEFTARCRCGSEIRVPQPEVKRAIRAFSPFRVRVEAHAEEVYARERLAAKWGPNSPPIPLDNDATSG